MGETLKLAINEELQTNIPKLHDQLEVIFVDAMHNTGNSKNHDHAKTRFKEEMDKLESFVTSVEPYSCNHEAFPGVNVLFQTILPMINEKDEKIKRLRTEEETSASPEMKTKNEKLETEVSKTKGKLKQ